MKTNSLLIGVFALASIAFAGSKTYDITISKAAKAGTVELAPGAYQLKVDGTTAVFTDSHHKSFTTAVKVEATAKEKPVHRRRFERRRLQGSDPLDHSGRLHDEDRVRARLFG